MNRKLRERIAKVEHRLAEGQRVVRFRVAPWLRDLENKAQAEPVPPADSPDTEGAADPAAEDGA
jgi:hypothetical protein